MCDETGCFPGATRCMGRGLSVLVRDEFGCDKDWPARPDTALQGRIGKVSIRCLSRSAMLLWVRSKQAIKHLLEIQ